MIARPSIRAHDNPTRQRRARNRIAALLLLAAGGCDGRVVVLGRAAPAPFRFEQPQVLAELSAPAKTDNPTLSADLLEIYFTSERGGVPADVWSARREHPDASFEAPALVREVNSPGLETSPALTPDALTLWVASDRSGGLGDLDIWQFERSSRSATWSTALNQRALNSPAKDIPRPVGQRGEIMPIGSDRTNRGTYQIYFATRSEVTDAFATPEAVSLQAPAHNSTVDGFLTDDGLTLFYCTGPAFGPADLYVVARRSTEEPFGAPAPLSALNSANDERDPFLSADGSQFFFSSDRSGQYEIYMARVAP